MRFGQPHGLSVAVMAKPAAVTVFTSRRMPPMSLEQLLSVGIKPERKKILIVKGVTAPRAAYEPIAAEIMLVDTPGSTRADASSFTFRRRRCPLYPLESDAMHRP
jgi:microcystin degradation protein MlrC